jgi:hypothetical protein
MTHRTAPPIHSPSTRQTIGRSGALMNMYLSAFV